MDFMLRSYPGVARMSALNAAVDQLEEANGKATLADRIRPKRREKVAEATP